MSRPRHPKPELEEVLKAAEAQGWRVTRGSKYYMMWCPCPQKHKKTVKITPNASYRRNLLGQLRRTTCFGTEMR